MPDNKAITLHLNTGTYQSPLLKRFKSAVRIEKTKEQREELFLENCKHAGIEANFQTRHDFDAWMKEEYDKPLYKNDAYQVSVGTVAKGHWPMVHLSIKRLDQEPIDENHWRILQEIKNLIVGPEHEGVELYPAEQRLMDTANQYHLWVLAEPVEQRAFPFGYFMPRAVATPEEAEIVGAKQRKLTP